jgi:hypothetical protein
MPCQPPASGPLAAASKEDATLDQWRVLLAPPKLEWLPTSSGSAESMALNSAWLGAHADEHRGEWVALRDDQLIDANRDFSNLHSRLPRDSQVTLVRIPLA